MNIQFVEVREIDPPHGEEPVVWRLATNRPIDTEEQIAAVVDAYRQRWQVEEFFKAIKTGCRYQQLQLENHRALLIALSIDIVVAWQLLLLRWAVRNRPDAPAATVLPEEFHPVLVALACGGSRHESGQNLTVRDALLTIANLAGHIKNNGPPGWLLLSRGYAHLVAIQRGWALATRQLGLPLEM